MSLTGRAAAAAAIGVAVVLAVPLGGAMVGYLAAALVAAVLLDIALAASPRDVGLTRGGASSGRLGEAAVVSTRLRNDGSRLLRAIVRDLWPPTAGATPRAQRVLLRPGDQVRLETTLTPRRRGERRAVGVTIRSVGPLGLAARQSTRPLPWAVQVLPPFRSRRLLPEKLARLRLLDGSVVAPVRGGGTEFDSLREYVVGDDTRSIDWRATARRGDVVVRTWRPERDRQLLLVLDSGRTAAGRVGDETRFDAAIDAALLLAALARHAGDRVGLLVHDRAVRATADMGATLPTVARAVAPVDPLLLETDMRSLVNQALRRLSRRSLIVLFTALDPAAVTEGLLPALPALTRRHTVVVASVEDPEVAAMRRGRGDSAAVYDAAAAEAVAAERTAVVHRLRRLGVTVSEAVPNQFASTVADTYLELKAAGRL